MLVGCKEVAIAQLAALDSSLRNRLTKKIEFYAAQPNPLKFAKPLIGYDAYRFRIGDYRVIFDIRRNRIEVLPILKREGAYRNL